MNQHPKTIAFYTLGCKLNFSETSTIAKGFIERGYELVDFKQVADVYVVHSCTVTQQADKKTRAAVRQANRRNPNAIISVIGCSAQLKPNEIATIEGVDVVLGTVEKFNLLGFINQLTDQQIVQNDALVDKTPFVPTISSDDRTRSFFKIQDGCDNFCAYCTIPFARGRSRSNTIEKTMETLHTLSDASIKEIVLTGVNIGDFGKKNDESFYDLLKRLDAELSGIERVRISSIEPDLLTDDMIKLVAKSSKLQPHFHIPLQVGSNRLLKAMNRKYDTTLFSERVALIKKYMPFSCIAVDVIVGLPGETIEDFNVTLELLRSLDISYLHVFSYSERELTKAIKLEGKVSVTERNIRSKILHELSEKKKMAFYVSNLNRTEKVLWESDNIDGFMYGFTENYVRVKTSYNKQLVNSVQSVLLDTLEDEVFVIKN